MDLHRTLTLAAWAITAVIGAVLLSNNVTVINSGTLLGIALMLTGVWKAATVATSTEQAHGN